MPEHCIMDNGTGMFVVLENGKARYGVECRDVREIMPVPPIMALPMQPDYIRGVCDYNGGVIAVLSLNRLLGRPDCLAEGMCVILETRGVLFGLSANAVMKVAADTGEALNYDASDFAGRRICLSRVINAEAPIFIIDLDEMVASLTDGGADA